jgi:hypothetical protein
MPKNPLTALPDYPKPVRKRLPGAYIAPELGPDMRKSLIKTLTEILRSADDDRVARFLSVAEEGIANYRKLTVPRVADEELLPEQLDRLEKAARDFHDAAYVVGAVGSSWIAQTQRILFADHAVLEDVQFERTLEAADWAQFTAEAIVRIRHASDGGDPEGCQLTNSWRKSRSTNSGVNTTASAAPSTRAQTTKSC